MPSTSSSTTEAISRFEGMPTGPRASSNISGSRLSNPVLRAGFASKYSTTQGSRIPSSAAPAFVAVMLFPLVRWRRHGTATDRLTGSVDS
jgi:hypothetical protein